jgi:hypothetical protein
MATRDELIGALTKADAAGDTESASIFASKIKAMDAAPAATIPAAGPSDRDKMIHMERAADSAPPSPPVVSADPSWEGIKKRAGETGDFLADVGKGAWKSGTDMALGLQQFITPGASDLTRAVLPKSDTAALDAAHNRLKAEAAAKEVADAPLMDRPGGMIGKYGTDIATSFLPMGPLTKATQGLNAAARVAAKSGEGAIRFLPKALTSFVPSVTTGAAQGVLTPSSDYDAADQAGVGAALGAAGDFGGRVLGRMAAPFHGLVNGVVDAGRQATYNAVDTLNKAGFLPRVLATHLLPEEFSGLTAQIAKTHGYKSGILAADAENRAALTARQAELAGVRGENANAISTAAPEMRAALQAEGDAFRFPNGADQPSPKVEMAPFTPKMQGAHDAVVDYAAATSQTHKADKLRNAVQANYGVAKMPVIPGTPEVPASKLLDAAGEPVRAAVPGTPATEIVGPPQARPTVRTTDELMDLRNAASEMAFKEQDPVLSAQYKTLANTYADAIESGLPTHMQGGLKPWLKKYGAMFDFERAASRSTAGARVGEDVLDPRKTFSAVVQGDAAKVNPRNANEMMLKLLAQTAPGVRGSGAGISSDLGRTLATVGLPSTAGGVAGMFIGEDIPTRVRNAAAGAALGAGGMKVMAHLLSTPGGANYLTGRYMGNSLADVLQAMRQAGAASAIQGTK